MRKKRNVQVSIFDLYSDHEIGKELKFISGYLDNHPEFLDWVELDLHVDEIYDTGRHGLSSETVLRCGLLKQQRQLSYKELSFHLSDSASFQAFARLPRGIFPKKSALQNTISRIKDITWERINQSVVGKAKEEKIESAQTVRLDSTVSSTDAHEPTDSSLLWDSVRVMVRLIDEANKMPAVEVEFVNHKRVAKRRNHQILNTKGMDEEKTDLYADLIKVSSTTLHYFVQAQACMEAVEVGENSRLARKKQRWLNKAERFKPLIQRVIDQSQRRVLGGESVPASEKIFSIFEDHTDIIIKGNRDIHYGHKLNLTSGTSGLILDIVIEQGNPTDIDRLLPMLERHEQAHGKVLRQVAADGGYASGANLDAVKAMGVEDMAFNKKRGLAIEDMVKSNWVYRKLKNFRAAIESNISCLKRSYGLGRCSWKGLDHFKSYIWSSVVSYNLTLMARLSIE